MFKFWIFFVVMIIVALATVIPAMLGRRRIVSESGKTQNIAIARDRLRELDNEVEAGLLDKESRQQAEREIEQSLHNDISHDERQRPVKNTASSSLWAVTIAVGIPILASGLYFWVGNPGLVLSPPSSLSAEHTRSGEGQDMPSVDEMVAKLEAKLEQDPQNSEGWFMLARSYMVMNRFEDAITAYEKLLQLNGDDPSILVRYADALAMLQGGTITGKSLATVKRALELDPAEPQGLWMAGMGAYQRGDFAEALDFWRKLDPLMAENPEAQGEIRALMAKAEEQINDKTAASTSSAETDKAEATTNSNAAINVSVSLADALADQVVPEDTVFVFARAPEGPPMPLAVARKQVKDLPLNVVLDDSMAMMPQMKLSSFTEVIVSARISKSGDPVAQSGDLQGQSIRVPLAETNTVEIVISDVVP